jgi:hypothetical protein
MRTRGSENRLPVHMMLVSAILVVACSLSGWVLGGEALLNGEPALDPAYIAKKEAALVELQAKLDVITVPGTPPLLSVPHHELEERSASPRESKSRMEVRLGVVQQRLEMMKQLQHSKSEISKEAKKLRSGRIDRQIDTTRVTEYTKLMQRGQS